MRDLPLPCALQPVRSRRRPCVTFEPVPPLFVSDPDVDAFESIEKLVAYVEPWDVTESMRAFDAHGRRVVVRSEGVVRTRFSVGGGRTFVDLDESGAEAAEELALVLRNYLSAIGLDRQGWTNEQLHNASLAELVVAASRWSLR